MDQQNIHCCITGLTPRSRESFAVHDRQRWAHGRGLLPMFVLSLGLLLLSGCASLATLGSSAILPNRMPRLTALELVVKLVHPGQSEVTVLPLPKDDPVTVARGDNIAIDEQGRALLELEDLAIELLRGAQVEIKDVRFTSGPDVIMRLKLLAGHSRADLHGKARRLLFKFETDYASISPTEPDTEFVVCHADGALTCIAALRGRVEVSAQGKVVTINGGESTYVFPGEPPGQPICANLDQIRGWLDQVRSNENVGDLGSLVIGWDKSGCGDVLSAVPEAAPPAATGVASGTVIAPSAAEMVKISAGGYTVGVAQPDETHAAAQVVQLPEFWIDVTETTNARYADFVGATGHPPPGTWIGGMLPAGKEQQPVAGLSWDDASAYCRWAGKRLPHEAEWEVAARGPVQNPPLFPWGDDPTAGGATFDLPQIETYAVGSRDFNRSPFGVMDTIGNVWEWTDAPYASVAAGMQVLRGGRHGLLEDGAFRQQALPGDSRFGAVAGVRCAADGVAQEVVP